MKAIVLDGYTLNPGDNPWSPVEAHCELQVYDRTPEPLIPERAGDAEIALTNKTPLTRDTIARLPRLKFISVLATGYNVVDVDAARERGIPVSNVPAYGTDSVAQYVMAVILARIYQPLEHSRSVYEGKWQASPDFTYHLGPLTELTDKTFGVIGYGRIGRRVAELAAAFRMNVLAWNPTLAGKVRLDYDRFDWCTMKQVFRESDFVSLHCPLTPENAGFVNADLLGLMKPGAVLINTARGGLVNEADLARFLNEGKIAGACLDVVSAEPIREDNPLLGAKNCIITPHNAWATIEARRRLMQITADNVEAFISGSPIHVVNR
jgi:glycerate dehydrogenase